MFAGSSAQNMAVSIIAPSMSQPSMGPCPVHSLRPLLNVISSTKLSMFFPAEQSPFLLPFLTVVLTTFYSEFVPGRELPGDKSCPLPASVPPRAHGTVVLALGTGRAPAWSQAGCVLLSAGCVRGPHRTGARAAGCWHLAWSGCGPTWPRLPCSLQLHQV